MEKGDYCLSQTPQSMQCEEGPALPARTSNWEKKKIKIKF